MNQCANCSSDNQITIAGKTFCANCGTPVQTTDSQTASSGAPVADVAVKAATAPLADGTNTQAAPALAPLAAPPSTVIAPKPAEPASANAVSSTKPIQPEPIAQSSSQQPAGAPKPLSSNPAEQPAISQAQPVPQPAVVPTTQPDSRSQPQTKAAAEITSKVQHAHDESSLQRLLEGQKTPKSAPQPQFAPTVSRVAPIKNLDLAKPNPAPASENVGSELGGLDTKNESVFSDAQLNELAKATQGSAKPSQSSLKVMSDIRPAASPGVEYIPPKHNTLSALSPGLSTAETAPVVKAVNSVQPPSILPPTTRANSQLTNARQTPGSGRVVEMGLPTHLIPKPNSVPTVIAQLNNSQPGQKKPGLKPASVALSLIGVVVVGLYVWQINYPNLAFKVASGKAGINASLPNYLPSGWKVSGDIQASPGLISYNVSNSNGSQQMQVQEAKTDWDSQALAENYVTQKSDNYLALQAQGLTIYMYGNNQASWINKGTWYRLEGNTSGLNQDQLIKIATSL
ncbi:DUF4367 domain-containing protein [Candidatus Saccharibacteria bacterium]|nr:DUF4367 domain-containing protein [Candidatus Saccharibacteria bacterium]